MVFIARDIIFSNLYPTQDENYVWAVSLEVFGWLEMNAATCTGIWRFKFSVHNLVSFTAQKLSIAI